MFDLEDCCRNHFLLLVPFFGTKNWRRLWEYDTKSRDDLPTKFKGEFLYDYFPNCFSIVLSFFFEISHYTYRFLVLMKKTKKNDE